MGCLDLCSEWWWSDVAVSLPDRLQWLGTYSRDSTERWALEPSSRPAELHALHRAVLKGNLEAVKTLVGQKVGLDRTDDVVSNRLVIQDEQNINSIRQSNNTSISMHLINNSNNIKQTGDSSFSITLPIYLSISLFGPRRGR